jgi:hypothetical protein
MLTLLAYVGMCVQLCSIDKSKSQTNKNRKWTVPGAKFDNISNNNIFDKNGRTSNVSAVDGTWTLKLYFFPSKDQLGVSTNPTIVSTIIFLFYFYIYLVFNISSVSTITIHIKPRTHTYNRVAIDRFLITAHIPGKNSNPRSSVPAEQMTTILYILCKPPSGRWGTTRCLVEQRVLTHFFLF